MAGRNGSDNLCRFLSVVVCVMVLIGAFAGDEAASMLWGLGVVGLVYIYFRVFSKNLPKRRAENDKYLALRRKITGDFTGGRDRWSQRKDYVFFRCPSCRTMLRVPRGKGKIKIICRKCGNSFIKKT